MQLLVTCPVRLPLLLHLMEYNLSESEVNRMFESTATFTKELLESTVELVTSILASGAPNERELIEALIEALRSLIGDLIEALETAQRLTDNPTLRAEIDTVIEVLRSTRRIARNSLRALIPAIRQNRQEALPILEDFVQGVINSIAALLADLFNLPSPRF